MSFNHYARKVRNPSLKMGTRWSALHSCILRLCWLTKQKFSLKRQELHEQYGLEIGQTVTEQQLLATLNAIESERNKKLQQLRVFERKRIREKMRGKRCPSP